MTTNIFEKLSAINVNEKTEKKGNLTYLSWAWAWAEVKKIYPDATYNIRKFGEEQKPYLEDSNTGYMCFTDVTIEGLTHEMWLPVMDYKNKAIPVGQATMFDINKTIMRCLVKNLAMFGLGLYIYSGEDLPEDDKNEEANKAKEMKNLTKIMNNTKFDPEKLRAESLKRYGTPNSIDLTSEQLKDLSMWITDLQFSKELEGATRLS